MKLMKLALCSAVATVALGGAAMAQDITVTGNVGITSDYVFRGISQTNEDPAIQGGVDLTAGLFYAGAWASNVDFGDSTDAEVDLYAGVKPQFAGFNFDVAAIYYGYVNQPSAANWDYWEGKVAVSRPFGPLTVGGAVYYSPEFTGKTGQAWYYEVNGAYAFNDQWSVSGAVGNQKYEDFDFDYTTWNLGVSWAFAPHLTADLRYHDVENDAKDVFGDIADSRGVLSIKAVFP